MTASEFSLVLDPLPSSVMYFKQRVAERYITIYKIEYNILVVVVYSTTYW